MLKQDLIANIDDKKKLLTYISSKLTPREQEKRINGEVFTPVDFIENKMLGLLEKETPGIFTKKNYKWLDPCNGIGNFPVCIYYRLMDGLKDKIKDEEKRRKHILENMIYVCEIDTTNVEIYKQIMRSDTYELNIYKGDYMEFTPDYFDIDSFDVVIGNPPYQKNATDGKYGSSLPFYNEFIDHSMEISNITMFVTPSRWFAGGKGLDKFRKKMLSKTDIKVIDHYPNSKDVFSHVGISGGVNIILIDSSYNDKCKFIMGDSIINVDLSKYDIISDPKYISLIQFFDNVPKLDTVFKTRGLYKLETNDSRLYDTKNANSVKCYVSQIKGFVKYVDEKNIVSYDKNQYFKVLTARAHKGGGSGFGNMFTSTPDEVYTNSYISFVTKSQEESESLLSYMRCKLPNVMLGLRKISQDISEKTCKWIPIVPFDRVWDDNEVNKFFKLSPNMVSLIDDYIKDYSVILNDKTPKSPKKRSPKKNEPAIEFEEINLISPDGTIKEVDNKELSKLTVVDLKKIAFNNNVSLTGNSKKKADIVKVLMSYPELNIED